MDKRRQELEALLVPELYSALWRFCRGLAPTHEDAEDLLCDSLAQALIKLPQLRERGSFKAWIFAIAQRRYLSLRRGRAWRERIAAAAQGAQDPAQLADQDGSRQLAGLGAAGGGVFQAASARGADPLALDVLAELGRLPQNQREVLELHYLHGLGLDEAAQVLGIRADAARQRLHRGQASLRAALGVEGPGRGGSAAGEEA